MQAYKYYICNEPQAYHSLDEARFAYLTFTINPFKFPAFLRGWEGSHYIRRVNINGKERKYDAWPPLMPTSPSKNFQLVFDAVHFVLSLPI